jgi:hypothetical protein
MQTTPRTTFFSLPTELRLQIAEYALEQTGNVGLRTSNREFRVDPTYNATSNLSILLVCRQFRLDFTNIAYQMTTFIFLGPKMQLVCSATDAKLQNLRKVVIDADWSQISTWQTYAFNRACLSLEELCIVAIPNKNDIDPLIVLLQDLRNVKQLRFFPRPKERHRASTYGRLIGAMYKYDHYRRYDAPKAPDVVKVWWRPRSNDRDFSVDLTACEPEPLMAEEEYMVMMKPKIDDLMMLEQSIMEMEAWSTPERCS